MKTEIRVCLVLFFLCGSVTVLLASILENYLMQIGKHEWFYLASAVPTLLDIFALSCSSYFRWHPRNFMRCAVGCSALGVMMMQIPRLEWIVAGRALTGLVYSQLPFFNRLVIAFSSQTTFDLVSLNTCGLMGYLLSPLILWMSSDPSFVLHVCAVMIIVSFCLITVWIPFFNEQIHVHLSHPVQNSLIRWGYFVLLQSVLNLTGACVFYLVSPILTSYGYTSRHIGGMLSMVVASQIVGNWLVFTFWTQNIASINRLFVPFLALSMLGLSVCLALHPWIIWMIGLILFCSFPDSLLTVTAVRLAENFPDPAYMLSLNGIITSTMYFVGPLMNMIFIYFPGLVLALPTFLWFLVWGYQAKFFVEIF
jgi:hypothetical protein